MDELKEVFDDPVIPGVFEKVMAVINDNAKVTRGSGKMKTQRCFAVKQGIDGMLDRQRDVYSDVVQDLESTVATLGEEHGLNLRVHTYSTQNMFN